MNSVFVTGIGSLTSLGQQTDDLWSGLLSGIAPVKQIPEHWSLYAESECQIYVPFEYDVNTHPCPISKIELLQHDPSSLIGMMSVYEALQNAGFELSIKDRRSNRLHLSGVDEDRFGVIAGSAIGGINTTWTIAYQYQNNNLIEKLLDLDNENVTELIDLYFRYRKKRLDKFVTPKGMLNSVSDSIAMKFNARAFSETVSLACSSGTAAIGKAYQQIALGQADVVIAGGSEYFTLPTGVIHKGFDLANALTKDSINSLHGPFDKGRTGFTYSEGGSGFIILESEAHLNKRGATPLAELSGYIQNYECFSMLAMEPSGKFVKRLHLDLLEQNQLNPGDIDYINSHGSGTPMNDEMEVNIISELYPKTTLVNSTKSILGHTIGASGGIECVATIKQMLTGTVHPNANLNKPLEGITLPTKPTKKTINAAISTSYAFGGHNAALLLKAI